MRASAIRPSQLALFWLGIQAVWGALLGVALQARTSELAGSHALVAYGQIATVGAIVAALTQLAAGPFSDRLRKNGNRRVGFFVGGALPAAGAVLWFYAAPNLEALVASFVSLQFAMNLAIGPYQAVIPDYVDPKNAGVASSWMAALQSVGNAFGVAAASFIADTFATAALLATLLLSSCAATVSAVWRLPLRPLPARPERITRAFLDLFASRALVYAGFYTLLGYLYFYVEERFGGLPAGVLHTTGQLALLFTAAAAGGAALAASPADRYDRRAVVSAAGAAIVAGIGAFLIPGLVAPYFAAAVAGLAWGGFLTADWAVGCAILPRSLLATAMGVWNLALLVPQAIAPALTTLVLVSLHALHAPHASSIAFGLAALEVAVGGAWIWRLPAALPRVSAGRVPAR